MDVTWTRWVRLSSRGTPKQENGELARAQQRVRALALTRVTSTREIFPPRRGTASDPTPNRFRLTSSGVTTPSAYDVTMASEPRLVSGRSTLTRSRDAGTAPVGVNRSVVLPRWSTWREIHPELAPAARAKLPPSGATG